MESDLRQARSETHPRQLQECFYRGAEEVGRLDGPGKAGGREDSAYRQTMAWAILQASQGTVLEGLRGDL